MPTLLSTHDSSLPQVSSDSEVSSGTLTALHASNPQLASSTAANDFMLLHELYGKSQLLSMRFRGLSGLPDAVVEMLKKSTRETVFYQSLAT